jgi:hypothetical protein
MKWGGILLALVLPWVFLLKPQSRYLCGTCGSWRDESQVRTGPSRTWSIPLGPVTRDVRLSEAAEKLLGPGHTHQWTVSKTSDGYVFIRWGILCGEGPSCRGNPFVQEWEAGMTFHHFVEGERRAGRITQDEVLAMAEVPRRPTFEQARDAKVVKAFTRAHELFKATGLYDTRGFGWTDWTLPGSPPAGCPEPPK